MDCLHDMIDDFEDEDSEPAAAAAAAAAAPQQAASLTLPAPKRAVQDPDLLPKNDVCR